MPLPISPTEIDSRLEDLDEELRDLLASTATVDAISAIEAKYKVLAGARISHFARFIAWYVLEFLSASDFITQLKALGIRDEEMTSIRKDIVEKIFAPYGAALKQAGINYEEILTVQPAVPLAVSQTATPPPQEIPVKPQPVVAVKPVSPLQPPTAIPVQKPGSTIEVRPFEPAKPPPPMPPPPPRVGAPRITFPQTPPVAVRPPEPSAPMPPPPPKEEEKIHIREVRFTPTPKPEEAPRVIAPQTPKAPEAPTPETKPTPTSFPPITFITPTEPPAPPPKPAQPPVSPTPPPVIKPEEKPKPAPPPGTEVIDLSTFEIKKGGQQPK